MSFDEEAVADEQPVAVSAIKTSAQKPPRRLPTAAPYFPPMSTPKITAMQPDLDRKTHKKLAKGRIDIDARIDLHGMTQEVAHHRLSNFIAASRNSGLRHLLVITGKGRSAGGPGVLRRMVPMWLTTEPLKHLVSGYSNSALQHGGEGALYVRLKRK